MRFTLKTIHVFRKLLLPSVMMVFILRFTTMHFEPASATGGRTIAFGTPTFGGYSKTVHVPVAFLLLFRFGLFSARGNSDRLLFAFRRPRVPFRASHTITLVVRILTLRQLLPGPF